MTLHEILSKLEALGSEKMRIHNAKNGAHDNQFGVKLGDIRALAKPLRYNQPLARSLWETENIDAQLLATLIVKPKLLSLSEVGSMVRSGRFVQVADWLNAYVVKKHPENETLRQEWMFSKDVMAARAGWSLTSSRVIKNAKGLDINAILGRIEAEMPGAAPEVQWTMNATLAQIGIHLAEHREQAIAIGEKLGIYKDYPVTKGGASPFAPIWIKEKVSRQL